MRISNETVVKVFSLTGELSDNSFEGVAAGIGNLDRGRDVIAPGAFTGTLEAFVRDGSAMMAHAWSDVAIGYVNDAAERESGLFVRATFHSTAKAQEIRTVMAERLAAHKTVGLSIGFRIEDDKWFENGDDLLTFAKGAGIGPLDSASITACKNYCRLIVKARELFEVSYAPIPMNASAMATAVKDIFGGDGSHAPCSLQDHSDTVLAAVGGLIRRLERYTLRKSGDDRSVQTDRLAEAEELGKDLSALLTKMRETVKPIDDATDRDRLDEASKGLQLRTLALRSASVAR